MNDGFSQYGQGQTHTFGAIDVGAASGGLGVFSLPVGRLAIVLVVGGAAGVLAGLRPARRAARLDVLRAIATE